MIDNNMELNDIDNIKDEELQDKASEAILDIAKENGKKLKLINKRIDFTKNSFKKLEMMIPVYKEEIEGDASNNEALSYVVQKAIDKLFDEDFKKRLEEL